MRPSRSTARKNFSSETRVALLEDDADKFEDVVVKIQDSLDGVKSWLVKSVIGLATGSALVALDIVLRTVAKLG